MNVDELSPKELKVLEFFARAYEENPELLKENLNGLSIIDKARTMAFLQVRVPKLYENIVKLLDEQN